MAGFTESDLVKMEEEVFKDFQADLDVERVWLVEQALELKKAEQQLVAAWRVNRHQRDDGQLKSISERLSKNRSVQATLKARYEEITPKCVSAI